MLELAARGAGATFQVTYPGDDGTAIVISEEALQSFAEDLAASRDDVELRVEARTIAETDATCLIAGDETICLSHEGAQLLADVGDERLSASAYTTDVPDGTFDT